MSGTAQPGTVGAVVVDFHAGHLLPPLLATLAEQGCDPVVVVDNSAAGATRAALGTAGDSHFLVVEAPGNGGFGSGVNLGVAALGTEFVVVANPDTAPAGGAVEALVAALASDPVLGIVAPALYESDGTLHQSARAFPSVRGSSWQAFAGLVAPGSAAARRYREANWRRAEERYVDWVSGAFFVVRRAAFDAVGGFDPGYFMYVEEVDLCWRLARAGWRAGYLPTARVVHAGGASASAHPYAMQLSRHRSLWRFARRTTEGRDRLALPLVAVGLCVRLALAWSRESLRRAARPGARRGAGTRAGPSDR